MSSTAVTSLAAWLSIDVKESHRELLELLDKAGPDGLTLQEACDASGPGVNTADISGRFTEMEKLSLSFRTGDTRPSRRTGNGQVVNRHAKFAAGMGVVLPTYKRERPKTVALLIEAAKAVRDAPTKSDAFAAVQKLLSAEAKRVKWPK